jgi:chromosome segregation ATPase
MPLFGIITHGDHDMASLQCEKKLRALDGLRNDVKAGTKDLSTANATLVTVTKQALQALHAKKSDNALLKAFFSARAELERVIGDLEKKLSAWESEHRKLIKSVLDEALDKAKREKNKELTTSCAPIKDYFEAAEEEINSVHSLIENAKLLLEKNRPAFNQYVFQGA